MTLDSFFRALPYEFKGKQRLGRMFFAQTIENKKDIIVNTVNGIYKLPNLKEPVSFSLFTNGLFEKEVTDFINKKIAGKKCFLDIGANIGSISIPVVNKNLKIETHCIEASPRVFSYLKYNKEANNLSNMNVYNIAITDHNIDAISFYSPEEGFGRGSLSAVFTQEAEIVKGVTLDNFLDMNKITKPDFIKIDIEGYEKQAFIGGKNLLSPKDAPDILFEFCDWAEELAGNKKGDAQRILLEYGYKLLILEENKLRPLTEIMESDFAMIYATKNN